MEDEPEKEFLHRMKHQPVWYESLMWVANSYIAQEKYKEAETVITLIRSEQNFPKKLKAELELVNTNLHLQQENWTKAATPLTGATDLTSLPNSMNKTKTTP